MECGEVECAVVRCCAVWWAELCVLCGQLLCAPWPQRKRGWPQETKVCVMFVPAVHNCPLPPLPPLPTESAVLFLLPQPTDKTVKPKAHKPVEALSVLFVLAHLWMGYFAAL